MLHQHGALAFFDYAAAGPYLPVTMCPPGEPDAAKDAVFLSPHKFVGGPGTPGILLIHRELVTNTVPVVPGGGTVAYVSATERVYLDDPVLREEGGTPDIVGAIRAGLVMDLTVAVGAEAIAEREDSFTRRAVDAWRDHERITVLGSLDTERLGIFSFVVHAPDGRYVHHGAVTALLNDLFGIQARGGCSCAGPYGHRLLGIDPEHSRAYESEILSGLAGIKPGWTRVGFHWAMSEEEVRFIVEAVELVADLGWALLPEYRFDPATGVWRHRQDAGQAPWRFTDLRYDEDGVLHHPVTTARAPESVLADYLDQARRVLEEAAGREPGPQATAGDKLPAEFERLRWFTLPAACLRP